MAALGGAISKEKEKCAQNELWYKKCKHLYFQLAEDEEVLGGWLSVARVETLWLCILFWGKNKPWGKWYEATSNWNFYSSFEEGKNCPITWHTFQSVRTQIMDIPFIETHFCLDRPTNEPLLILRCLCCLPLLISFVWLWNDEIYILSSLSLHFIHLPYQLTGAWQSSPMFPFQGGFIYHPNKGKEMMIFFVWCWVWPNTQAAKLKLFLWPSLADIKSGIMC